MKEIENLPIIAKELEKQNAYRLYEIESETNKEKAYVELKKELSKIEKKYDEKNQKDNEKVNRNHNHVNKRMSVKKHESDDMVMTENETDITRILHAMMYGVGNGSQKNELTSIEGIIRLQKNELMSITEILLYYVNKGLLPVEVAMDAVENIGKKCRPPMEKKEIVSVWNKAIDNYN